MNRLTVSVAALFFSFGTLLYAQQSSAASLPDWNGNNGSWGDHNGNSSNGSWSNHNGNSSNGSWSNHNGNSSNGSYGDHDRKYSKKHSSYNKFDRKENNFNHGRTDNTWRASYNKHDKKGNNNSSYGNHENGNSSNGSYGNHDKKFSKKTVSFCKSGKKVNGKHFAKKGNKHAPRLM